MKLLKEKLTIGQVVRFKNYKRNKEEKEAYIWEYEFLCKLPNVEDWLFLHAINQIIRYSH